MHTYPIINCKKIHYQTTAIKSPMWIPCVGLKRSKSVSTPVISAFKRYTEISLLFVSFSFKKTAPIEQEDADMWGNCGVAFHTQKKNTTKNLWSPLVNNEWMTLTLYKGQPNKIRIPKTTHNLSDL